ncbi:MAG: glycosyltransferase family 2 protein [Chlorobiales bacterium]|nr:glycosyltransferase family 2 protein [Chlorobiales bacterium]
MRQIKAIVIVPAYNEAETMALTIQMVKEELSRLEEKAVSGSVMVVDDGSTDSTADEARRAGADRLITHKLNQGLGAAVRSGLEQAYEAGADVVIKFDADQQHDPKDIPALIKPIVDDEADLVYGHRFERIEYRMPFVRRMGNMAFTALMRWLTGWPLKDSQPGIFAVHRRYLKNFYLPGDYNYSQQLLLDAYHRRMRFAHVPVSFRKRLTGQSFVSPGYPLKVMTQILMVVIGVKPLKIFGPLGLFFLGAGGILFLWEMSEWILGFTAKPVRHVNAVMGLTLFGLQTLFFGFLAHLIVQLNRRL